MTRGPDEMTWIQICHARSMLRRTVGDLLRGSGLEIRELANALSIGNPSDPEKGRVYIMYATGDVSHRLVTWDFLGPLHGYEPGDDPDREPSVDAAKIIATLVGEPSRPAS
ncbi:MAG TPA: hypothetical protein VGH27_04510 [Streptosporangiaceae bacterium]|jgi:hypothetical protein